MTLSFFVFVIIHYVLQSHASAVTNLADDLNCICLSQVTCDLSRPQSFIFSQKSEAGIDNYFISTERPPRILKINPSIKGAGREETMGWVNVGTRELPKVWVLHFDPDGRIRHHDLTEQTPWEDDSGLKNWLEAKRLEEILLRNGIPLEKKRFDMGTWLLRQSDAVGILPAEGLGAHDESLNEVIRKYHDESLFPSRAQAYEFQMKYRDLFKHCNPREGLCQLHGWSELGFSEVPDEQNIPAWQDFYQNRVKANLAAKTNKNLPPQCLNGLELELKELDSRPQSQDRKTIQ